MMIPVQRGRYKALLTSDCLEGLNVIGVLLILRFFKLIGKRSKRCEADKTKLSHPNIICNGQPMALQPLRFTFVKPFTLRSFMVRFLIFTIRSWTFHKSALERCSRADLYFSRADLYFSKTKL